MPAGKEGGLQYPRWLRGKFTGSQGTPRGSRRRLTGRQGGSLQSQGGQGGGLQGHRGPRGTSTGSITGLSRWGKGEL